MASEKVLPCVVLLIIFFSAAHSRTLCSRIFFHNIDEHKLAYKFIEGVFVKQGNNYNNFPVYKRENDNLLFYRKTYKNGGESLLFSTSLDNLDNYYGVGARTMTSSLVWLSTGTLDRSDVFGGLISYWIYYDSRDKTNYRVSTPPYIKAICVDDDFRECNSDRVYFNTNLNDGKGNLLNNIDTDYFERQTDDFRNLRPVYKHNRQNWYLQYTSDQYWLITSTVYPNDYNDRGVFLRVNDLALRPEYINTTWSVHYNGWRTEPSYKLRCRGVRSQANICSTSPCSNGGTCVFTSGNETVCVCPAGYYGVRCTKHKLCPTPRALNTELGFGFPGNNPGYLAMTFCRTDNPSERFAFCTDGGYSSTPYWKRQGSACGEVVHTTEKPYYWTTKVWEPWTTQAWRPWHTWNPRSQPTPSPRFNSNDIPGLNIAILSCAIILQVLLAFIVWTCACCKKSCKEVDEDEEDQRRLDEFEGRLGGRLENVRRAQSQEELDQGVEDYRRTVEEYQQQTEATQLKRKKGVYCNAGICRLLSMQLFISFYLWLIYVLGCRATQCSQYGDVFGQLVIMAIVMLVIAPLFVLIESLICHELDYISNIMHDETAWSYIQRMHAVAPVINMTVECYHWETRTRVVYYTDANGNTQSRTETYQERVVTYVDTDEFKYGCWVDASKREMPTLSYVALTRVKIDSYILFGDQETEDDFAHQTSEMLDRNRDRDDHMNFSFDKSIPGLEKRISAYVDLTVKPWWIGKGYFWLATLLMMTWPYRWLFRAKTAKAYYDMKKKMYKSTSPPPEVDIMDPIAILQQTSNLPESNSNPSFAMTELPSSTAQPSLNTAQPPYPGQNHGQVYPPTNQKPPILPANEGPRYSPGPPAFTTMNQANQLPSYPTANQGAPYPSANQVPAYPIPNQGPAYPTANQAPPYPLANQAPPYQGMPSIPPPAYDSVVGPVSQSAPALHGPNAHA